MHISHKVAAGLLDRGFSADRTDDIGDVYYVRTVQTGGAFGSTKETVRMDSTRRWLERVDGWGKVEVDVDLRAFGDADDAIGMVLA